MCAVDRLECHIEFWNAKFKRPMTGPNAPYYSQPRPIPDYTILCNAVLYYTMLWNIVLYYTALQNIIQYTLYNKVLFNSMQYSHIQHFYEMPNYTLYIT